MTFSYDPTKIRDAHLNQMRFELGDTAIDGGAETCALCDEEYNAILTDQTEKPFRQSKADCLYAIKMKFSFEVDCAVGGMSLSLSKRYERWEKMWEQMEKSRRSIVAGENAFGMVTTDAAHYFYAGMNDNTNLSSPVRDTDL